MVDKDPKERALFKFAWHFEARGRENDCNNPASSTVRSGCADHIRAGNGKRQVACSMTAT